MKEGLYIIESDDLTMISVIKCCIIIFLLIVVYKDHNESYLTLVEFPDIASEGFFLLVSVSIFVIWIIIQSDKVNNFIKNKNNWIFEILFFLLIISLCIGINRTSISECKYIFLLLIIISVIQYGLLVGIITAICSSIIVVSFHIVYSPITGMVNLDLESDFIMCGIFIIVSWVIGHHVNITNRYNRIKDEQLYDLKTKLEDKDKSKRYVEYLLLKNKECSDILFESSRNSIILHDKGEIIYANKGAINLLENNKTIELTKKSLYEYYNSNDKELLEEKYVNIIDNKIIRHTSEENIVNCNKETILVRNTSSFFIYEGKSVIMTFLLDISSEKQIEELKKDIKTNEKLLNETKEYNLLITEFFCNISHELKTPINVIYSAVQCMDMYMKNFDICNLDKLKSYSGMIKQNSFRLIKLVTNLLDSTKLDSGFIELNAENGDIVKVVEDITLSVAAYAESKDLEVIFDTNIEEKIIAFDYDKIERILLNLLSNSFKYTSPEGKVNVYVEDKETSVKISVKDTGFGIPENKLNYIFERFGQVNKSLSRQCEGTGIGLYLVKSFVEMHNGKISVNSIEGQGSEFVIEIPAILKKEKKKDAKSLLYQSKIEKIHIEFSDIYSINI